ncbi:hypothetical protein, partial [Escherichia coli]|uniref:hypothetical protein n=1 Tax=Escherichia coli TaxID=562 RepID=UPI00198160B2
MSLEIEATTPQGTKIYIPETEATASKNNSVVTSIELCKLILLHMLISAFCRDAFLTTWLTGSSHSHSSRHPVT